MIELEDLGLKPTDLRKIKKWLNGWYIHFREMADNRTATVERYNLENLDFFYFTDCRDVLNKNPESKGQEDSALIRKRKRAVEYSLIFRRLLGEQLGKNRPCSHCGNKYRWINSLGDGTGHYVYCPKCAMTTIVTYPVGYDTCIERIKEDIEKNAYNIIKENKKITGEDLTTDLVILLTDFEEQAEDKIINNKKSNIDDIKDLQQAGFDVEGVTQAKKGKPKLYKKFKNWKKRMQG